MSKWRLLSSSLAFLICLVGENAKANLMIFEPDDYVVGANLSNANPYVSLATFRSSATTSFVPVFAPVSVGDCTAPFGCVSTTGSKVFRSGFGGIVDWGGLGTGGISSAGRCLAELSRSEPLSSVCVPSRSRPFPLDRPRVSPPSGWRRDSRFPPGRGPTFVETVMPCGRRSRTLSR